MATGDLYTKFREDQSSGSRDMLAETDTQTDRQVDHNTPHPYQGQSKKLLSFTKLNHLNLKPG